MHGKPDGLVGWRAVNDFYDEMRELAVEMIGEFGSGLSATFTRKTSTGFDPIEGTETFSTTTHTALVVVPPDDDRSREEARTLGWDVRFYLPAGFEPRPGDLVTLPGRSGPFTVIAPVEAMAPDGEAIAYTVRARKG